MTEERSPALRAGLLALAGLGVAGTLAELASIRHWDGTQQAVPWVVLGAAAALLVLLVLRPSRRIVRAARIGGLLVAAAAVYGVIVHVVMNMDAAVLDGTVGPTWNTLPLWRQVWMAGTGGVGAAPPLAAGSLAPTGLAIALATVGHPALAGAGDAAPAQRAPTPAHAP